MLITLARKELREMLPIVAVTLLVQTVIVCAATGKSLGILTEWFDYPIQNSIPFVDDSKCMYLLVVSFLCAIAVGGWQTLWEFRGGTFLFLLHRPVRRETIMATKLAIGVTLSVLVLVLPMLYYAWWAATPGTHASPFEWEMTTFVWCLCCQMPGVYLGAFLSGLRPGRWYGSRLLPLITAVAFAGVMSPTVVYVLPFEPAFWSWLLWGATLLLGVGYVTAILHVARTRDYS